MVVPAVFLGIARFELFPPPGWVDPEMYLGFFLNFPRALARFGPDYFSMRLPWTLMGFAAHRILAPNMANYAMVLSFYYLAIGSAYLIMVPRYGRIGGIAAAWWLAFNPLWLAAATRGYVDGPAMAFMLAGFACLINRGRLFGHRRDLCLAGSCWAFAVFTHPMTVFLTAMGGGAWLLGDRPSRSEFVGTAAWVAIGGIAATLALATAGSALGAPFLFFTAYAGTVKHALAGSGMDFIRPAADWLPGAYRMIPPFAFVVVGGAFLLSRRDCRAWSGMVLLAVGLMCASIVWLELWNLLTAGVTFQVSHYSSYLLPAQALVFGAIAGEVSQAQTTDRKDFSLLTALVVSALLPVLAVERLWQWEGAWREGLYFWLVPVSLFALAAIMLFGPHRRIAIPLLMLATVVAGTANLDTRRIFRAAGNPDYKPYYRAAIRLNDIVQGAGLDGRRLYFWYNRQAFTTGDARRDAWLIFNHSFAGASMQLGVLDSLTSIWLWDRTNLNFDMPHLSAAEARGIAESAPLVSLVLLCQRQADCTQGVDALAKQGIATVTRVRERIVEDRALDLTVLIVDTVASQ
ncbi:MAG TPA: hypothetical protein VHT74_05710 [Acetobacteraceae bacterium]|nr:hypothetical protein [Acetobacteraceae bacterium]